MIETSVFPVPPRGTQTVRLIYEEVLRVHGDRVDYVFPRSESLVSSWIPWHLDVRLVGTSPISTVYSPSHGIETVRGSDREVHVRLEPKAEREPGSFQLSYLLQGAGEVYLATAAQAVLQHGAHATGGTFRTHGQGFAVAVEEGVHLLVDHIVHVIDYQLFENHFFLYQ